MGPIPPIPPGKVAVKICRWVIIDLPKLEQIATLLGIDETAIGIDQTAKGAVSVTIIAPKTRRRSKRNQK